MEHFAGVIQKDLTRSNSCASKIDRHRPSHTLSQRASHACLSSPFVLDIEGREIISITIASHILAHRFSPSFAHSRTRACRRRVALLLLRLAQALVRRQRLLQLSQLSAVLRSLRPTRNKQRSGNAGQPIVQVAIVPWLSRPCPHMKNRRAWIATPSIASASRPLAISLSSS